MIGWIILAIVVFIVIFIIFIYNNLVTLRQRVQNAWGQIDVQLQRRFDLIPNLVETVKGYMAHEKDTLTKVTELRSSWSEAKTIEEKVDLENELSNTLKTIMAVAENYPELKANQSFNSLQDELSTTENKIAYSRQFYNDTVTKYNTKLELFPNNLVAGILGFKPSTLFNVDSEEVRKSVKVDFGNSEEY